VLLCWHHHHAVHEGGFRMKFEHGQVSVWRPDGTLLHSESLLADGPDIVEQNAALGLEITPEFVAPEWDGRRLTPRILADTVEGLLWLEDRHRQEVAAMNAALVAAEPLDGLEPDYPDVIVIDDEDDGDFAVA